MNDESEASFFHNLGWLDAVALAVTLYLTYCVVAWA